MTEARAGEPEVLSDFDRMTRPGFLADYASVEVTEVFAIPPGGPPTNVLVVAVCEDAPAPANAGRPDYLGDRIRLPGLKTWGFGVKRYRRSLAEFRAAIGRLAGGRGWDASGDTLAMGPLRAQRPAFVTADGLEAVSLNAVLKNNFYGGAHVLELADPAKSALAVLLETPTLLKALGKAVAERGGPGLDAISDRLGNFLIQFPIELVAFQWFRTEEGVGVSVDWRPGTQPRPLTVSAQGEPDAVLGSYASARLSQGVASLPIGHHGRPHRVLAWDETEGVLLASTGVQAFINRIVSTTTMETGRRILRTPEGELTIAVQDHAEGFGVGVAPTPPNGPWEGRRLYRESVTALNQSREFKTYGGGRGSAAEGHREALDDIRWLIERHGRNGAWLWDPYLSGADLVETLTRCPHSGVALRALTEGRRPICDRPETAEDRTQMEVWIEAQKTALDDAVVDDGRLDLEFRVSRGEGSWRFHDRFLIFPGGDRPALVWSLGTSVNQAGAAHHILQKVPDGQRIADDFVRLWEALPHGDQLIWKRPNDA